jgi:tricorn protease
MVADSASGYLRFPSIAGDMIVFICEDDLWSVPAAGGLARRLTADLLGASRPILSPDARLVAFTSDADGPCEIHVVAATGGMARRLTWQGETVGGFRAAGLGAPTKVLGWTPDGHVAFASPSGQPFSTLTMAYAVSAQGAPRPELLPFGVVSDLSYGPDGGVVIGRNTADPAYWKRYRGGTAGSIWVDREGDGDFEPLLRPEAVGGNLASPMWVGDRIFFLSDHEGIGNLYSCSPTGTDIARHTDHGEYYARLASSDGARIVYQVGGRLWRYDPATDKAEEVPVALGSPRTQRQPRFVPAGQYLGGYQLDKTGKRIVLDTRGKLFSFAPFDRPVIQHGQSQGARYRLASFLGEGTEIVTVSDASGREAIEVHRSGTVQVLDIADLGRVVELVPSPDGAWLAVTDHKNRLFLVAAQTGESRLLEESVFGRPASPTWSTDSRWVAYSSPASPQTSQIKLAGTQGPGTVAVTEAQFRDGCPSFDPTGKYLYFLSWRTFDPVYDNMFFDLGFPLGARPYLVTLQASAPSPFLVRPEPEATHDEAGASGGAEVPGAATEARPVDPPAVVVDLDGIGRRIVEVPVPEARYEAIVALKNKLLLFSRLPLGALERDWASTTPAANATLEYYDLVEDRRETLVTEVVDLTVSGDRSLVAYTMGAEGAEGRRLRLVPASEKPDSERANEPPGRRSGFVDLDRVRVFVEPGAEWAQMVREAWRLQQDQFWTADLSGVDWQRVLDRYLPLVDQVATRTELADLIWELQGELGTSHCYEMGGEYRKAPPWGQAFLGADLARDGSGRWVVARVVPGASWSPKEASPLGGPGASVTAGTAILAVNGQPIDPDIGPGPLLANQAGLPVELTVSGPDDQGAPGRPEPRPRTVVVPTLDDERPLRYRHWVDSNRAQVREATNGRAGYVHIPDMGPPGWSEFHRSYRAEVEHDALIVDVRFNRGGHVSGLILEKLRRRRLGWDVPRWGLPSAYPAESPAGPLVALTNEWAGSDGDIFTHGFKLFGLGPVVGTRTWGGVIGIDLTLPLVDGSLTTQPEYAFWFEDVGWAVENYGSEPTEEVVMTPQDYVAGRDPQLGRAIELVLDALQRYQPLLPSRDEPPSKALPVLPPRGQRP